MDIKLILTIGIVVVVGILYAVKIFVLNKKKDPSETELEDVLEQYIEQIIQTGAKIISILQINRDNYASEEEYNLALASHAAIEVKKLINESDIPDYIKDSLTIEIVTQFVLRVFDVNRGLLGDAIQEESELLKVRLMNNNGDSFKIEPDGTMEIVGGTITNGEVIVGKEVNITTELNDFYRE